MANPRSTRRQRSARGFSFPDLLAAVSVLGLSVLGVQGLLLGLTEASSADVQYAVAAELAQAELEDLRSLHYSDVSSRTTSARFGGLPFSIDSVVTADAPEPETKHIETTVSWVSESGADEQLRLETIYAQVMP